MARTVEHLLPGNDKERARYVACSDAAAGELVGCLVHADLKMRKGTVSLLLQNELLSCFVRDGDSNMLVLTYLAEHEHHARVDLLLFGGIEPVEQKASVLLEWKVGVHRHTHAGLLLHEEG